MTQLEHTRALCLPFSSITVSLMHSMCIHCLQAHWTHSAPFPRLMSYSNVPKHSQHSYSCPSSCPGTAVVRMTSFSFVCSTLVPSPEPILDLTSSLVSGTSVTLLDDGRSESIAGAIAASFRLCLVFLAGCKVAFFVFSSALFLADSLFCFLLSSLSHFLFSFSSFLFAFFLPFLTK